MRRLITLLLAFMMLVSMMPTQAVTAIAAEIAADSSVIPTEETVDPTKPSVPEETVLPTEADSTTPPTKPEETTPPTKPEETTPPTESEETTPPTESEETTPPTKPEETTPPTEPEETTPPTEPEETTPPTEPEETTPPTEPEETEPLPFDETITMESGHAAGLSADAGVVPNDAVMHASVKPFEDVSALIKPAEPGLESGVAFDLSITDADGETIQPQGTLTVTLTVADLLRDLTGKTVGVYYVDPDQSIVQKLPAQVNAQQGTVTFTTDHFSLYVVTVNQLPVMAPAKPAPKSCTCVDPCGETVNENCEACAADAANCRWRPEGMTADRLAELYRLLPDADSITLETPESERKALMARLILLSDLYDSLMESNPDEAFAFEEKYADLYFHALALDTAITGYESILFDAVNYDVPFNSSSSRNCTITMGTGMKDELPTVFRYVSGVPRSYQVVSAGNGQYRFTRDETDKTDYYVITGVASDGASMQRVAYGSRSSVTLSSVDPGSSNKFDLFYVYSNALPTPYVGGSNSNSDYGPSGNGVAMVTVTVNTQKLRQMPNVVLGSAELRDWWDYSVNWYFVPHFDANGNVSLAAAKAFWNDVKACMDESSLAALESTGMADIFVGYLVKNQGGERHGDGILDTSKMYVAELHVNNNYFASVVSENDQPLKKMTDVLALCNQYLGGTVSWQSYPSDDEASNSKNSVGYYFNGNKVTEVTVTQKAGSQPVDGTNIRYDSKKSGTYYLAQFNMTTRDATSQFFKTITYTDGVADEVVFQDISYPVKVGNNVATYPNTPSRTGYRFDGWILKNTPVDGWKAGVLDDAYIASKTVTDTTPDLTFEAKWTMLTYTVTWENADGTELEKDENVAYGTTPSYDKAEPTKEENAQYAYTFSGWSPALSPVTADVTYVAQYQEVLQKYVVQWRNGNSLMETDIDVPYGTAPSYDGQTPTKAATAQYTYTFAGWGTDDDEDTPALDTLPNVSGNVVYYAKFTKTVNSYTVTWDPANGSEKKTETLKYGDMPSYGEDPEKEADLIYSYTFAGWTPTVTSVTGDVTYTATYTPTKIPYTVTWENHDGEILEQDTLFYGDMPVYDGDEPVKASTQQNDFAFSGWSPAVEPVAGNAVYTAQFTQTVRNYQVVWNNYNGKTLETDTAAYGTHPSYSGTTPVREDTANYTFTFLGWKVNDGADILTQAEVENLTVTADMTLTAQYTPVHKGYAVTVNVILDAQKQENGNMSGGTNVTIESMMGSGVAIYMKNGDQTYPLTWDSTNMCYTSQRVPNGTYYLYTSKDGESPLSSAWITVDNAAHRRNVYFYSVKHDPNGGSLNGSSDPVTTYHRGQALVAAAPQREGYYFKGWKLIGGAENAPLLQPGAVLSEDIGQPYELVAQWSNVQVNITVVVEHRAGEQGRDVSPSGALEVELAYRTLDSSEPYVEVADREPVLWPDGSWYSEGAEVDEKTTLTVPAFTALDGRFEYSATAILPDYEVYKREVLVDKTVDADSRVYNVTLYLRYNPDLFTLNYHVATDPGMAESLYPSAVDVKIYSRRGENSWKPITAHTNYSVDVMLANNGTDANGNSYVYGSGSYSVPVVDTGIGTFFYRTAAVGFTFLNARSEKVELTASETTGLTDDAQWSFASNSAQGYPAGAYTALLTYDPVPGSGHHGAHGDLENGSYVQKGDLHIVVTAHPATLKLNLNYAAAQPVFETIENVFVIPDLSNYKPEREGYTFRGWYLDAECTQPATPGTELTLDAETVLYAKWNRHLTVQGTVTVSATYTLGTGSNQTTHLIYPDDRLDHVVVRIMNERNLPVASVRAEGIVYEGAYGTISYSIPDIPDDGTRYTVSLLRGQQSYYTDTYQNEPDSLTIPTSYGNYATVNNLVVTGEVDPAVATVNAFLQFVPVTFDLDYQIDASAVAPDYRPVNAKTLVMVDDDPTSAIKWIPISQMVQGSQYHGQSSQLGSDGKSSNSYPVWEYHANGNLYNYSLRLQSLTFGSGEVVDFSNAPYSIGYNPANAYYAPNGGVDSDQTEVLKITIVPKTYPITYVKNGGTMPVGQYHTSHTWSFETAIDAIPTRDGYTFDGWYTSADFAQGTKCTRIDADVQEAVTLYAKWNPNTYRITYTGLEGAVVSGNPDSYTPDTETFTLVNPVKTGYTFLGWTGSNGNTMQTAVSVAKGTVGDLTFTANWKINTYTIEVTVENGTAVPGGTLTLNYGESKAIVFEPAAGYTLDTVTVDGNPAVLTPDTAENSVKGSYAFNQINQNHTIHVVYSQDSDGDKIPDDYQATVTYTVVNGTFPNSSNLTYKFDLKTYVNGQWVDANPTLGDTIPTVKTEENPTGEMEPIAGYHPIGEWIRQISATTPVTEDITYTWYFTKPITFTVTYPNAAIPPVGDGLPGVSITSNIPYGKEINVIPNGGTWSYNGDHTAPTKIVMHQNVSLGSPTRPHYRFLGWLQTSGTENNVVYNYTAQWEPVEYTITYHAPYSMFMVPNPTTYNVTTETFTLYNPFRAGYDFAGWTGTDLTGASTTVTIAQGSFGNRTYTANWTPRSDTAYVVEHYQEDLVWTGEEPSYTLVDTENETATTDTQVTGVDKQYPGFTLNQNMGKITGTVSGDGSLVLKLYYDRNTYSVTWKDAEGVNTLETDTGVRYGAMPSFDGTAPSKANTDQYTYSFVGWNTSMDQKTDNVSAVTGDAVYYAQFKSTVNQYTIQWMDYDRQLIESDTQDYGTKLSFDKAVPLRESTSKYHFTFAGWKLPNDDKVYTQAEVNDMTVEGDVTLTAYYNADLRRYTGTVNVFVDNSAITDEMMEDGLLGQNLYLGGYEPAQAPATGEEMVYHILTGSNGSYSSNTLLVDRSYQLYMGDEQNKHKIADYLTLSIEDGHKSARLDLYTVTYQPGYTAGEGEQTPSADKQIFVMSDSVTVAPAFTRTDYIFRGWKYKDSNNAETIFMPGDTLTDDIEKAYVLTAVWEETVKLDLTVVVQHAYQNDPTKGKDTSIDGTMGIKLAYRANNTEPYVEVVGAATDRSRSKEAWYDAGTRSDNGLVTTTTFHDLYTALDQNYQYSVNVKLADYAVISKEEVFNAQTQTYEIKVTLQYNPQMFTLNYYASVHASVPSRMIPMAVDMKIYSWKDNAWSPISIHQNYSWDILFNLQNNPLTDEVESGDNRYGMESYELPVYASLNNHFFYRTAAVGFTLGLGSNKVELTASPTKDLDNEQWTFASGAATGYPYGAYTAVQTFNAATDGHIGSHGDPVTVNGEVTGYTQKGTLQLLVSAHPGTVILDLDGGSLTLAHAEVGTDQKVRIQTFSMPDLSAAPYIPTRDGYTFRGWVRAGVNADVAVTTGTLLGGTADDRIETVEYKAVWVNNYTIQGNVQVEHHNGDLIRAPEDWLQTVTVSLHKKHGNLWVSVPGKEQTITLNRQQNETHATGTYEFSGIPNEVGAEYCVIVTQIGYSVGYKNENASIFSSAANANVAVDGAAPDGTLKVDIELIPDKYNLNFQMNAKQLGAGFRPKNVKIYIAKDIDATQAQNWQLVYAMQNAAGTADPQKAALLAPTEEAGMYAGSIEAWRYRIDGYAYNYALSLQSMQMDLNSDGDVLDEGETIAASRAGDFSTMPFDVHYKYPAFYKESNNGQDSPLIATLIPKTFGVTVDLDGGQWPESAVITTNSYTHTWSHPTNVAVAEPQRTGYAFRGWMAVDTDTGVTVEGAFVQSGNTLTVAAHIAQNLTLKPVWVQKTVVTVTGDSVTIVYDSLAHTYTASTHPELMLIEGLQSGHKLQGLTFSVNGTNHGTYTGSISQIPNSSVKVVDRENNDQDVTWMYDVQWEGAAVTLHINRAILSIHAVSMTHVYDGQTFGDFTYSVSGILEQNTSLEDLGLQVTDGGSAVSAVDVGTYSMVPQVTGSAANYLYVTSNGTLTITQRPISLKLVAQEKDYDGTTDAPDAVVVEDIGENETSAICGDDVVQFQAEQIVFDDPNVNRATDGSVLNRTVVATGVTLGGKDSGNYQITTNMRQNGVTLTTAAKINPVDVTVTLTPKDRQYNGDTQVELEDSVVVSGTVNQETVTVTIPEKYGRMNDAYVGQNKDVTVNGVTISDSNYNLDLVVEPVTISPREVTLVSKTAAKVYDGLPLEAKEINVDEVLAADATVVVTGRLEGTENRDDSCVNTISVTWNEAHLKDNYILNPIEGSLKIHADINDNDVPDSEETRYTVTYRMVPHSAMSTDKVYDNLLTGLQIPAPPVVTDSDGKTMDVEWYLKEGPEGDNHTIGSYNLVYEPTVTYKISYELNGAGAENHPQNPSSYIYGTGIPSFQPAEREEYIFLGWYTDIHYTVAVESISTTDYGDRTLYARWVRDVVVADDVQDPDPAKPGDGVPDIYQVEVTYKIVNGTWDGTDSADKTCILTHSVQNSDGTWSYGLKTLGNTVPTGMQPATGYQAESGAWDRAINANTLIPNTNITYTYTYGELIQYTVTLTVDNGTAKHGNADYVAPVTVSYGSEPTFSFTANTGYALDSAQIEKTVDGNLAWVNITLDGNGAITLDPMTESVRIHVVFAEDYWLDADQTADDQDTDTAGTAADPTSDGIPDNRQVLITYRSASDNGILTGQLVQVATLTADEHGAYTGQVTPSAVTATAAAGYALDVWTNAAGETVADPFATLTAQGGDAYTFTAHWAQDIWLDGEATADNTDTDTVGTTTAPESDGIADTKQAVVRYEVVGIGGSLTGRLLQVVTVSGGANAATEIVAPTVVPENGYKLERWVDAAGTLVDDPFTVTGLEGGKEYLFKVSFEADMKTVTYADAEILADDEPTTNTKSIQSYKHIQIDPNGGKWNSSAEVQTVIITEDTSLAAATRTGWIFHGWKCTAGPGVQADGTDIRYVFTAQWERDASEDGIADKYQKKVVFRIYNGVWGSSLTRAQEPEWVGTDDDIVYYVTLRDRNNEISKYGSADISDLIPTKMTANRGYHKGAWDVTPPITVTGNDSVVYTYSFVKKDTNGSPTTGDDIMTHLALMGASGLGLAVLFVLQQRRKRRSGHNQ